jgi:hypothetical protein
MDAGWYPMAKAAPGGISRSLVRAGVDDEKEELRSRSKMEGSRS